MPAFSTGAFAKLGDFDAVLFGIVVRLVVVHDHQQRNAMFGRGPERARSHQHVAVGLDRHGELAAAFERQSRADGSARAVTQTGAAAAAEGLIRAW